MACDGRWHLQLCVLRHQERKGTHVTVEEARKHGCEY